MGAAAKFAMAGKTMPKKDLAMLAMGYGHPYVARVALGAKDAQTVSAFREADSYSGTSVIIAYSHCIAHGYDLANALDQQEAAVTSGYWPLFRYDPRRVALGETPLKLDSSAPKIDLAQFVAKETRFRQVEATNPEAFKKMLEQAQRDVREKYALYEQLSKAMHPAVAPKPVTPGSTPKAQA
jgi:pyruvate-ferredoxin/flavodoxin oxidoreductase